MRLFKFYIVFTLIFGWIFSGWPPLWQNPRIPPAVPIVRAVAAPAFQAAGTKQSGTGALTVGWPTHQVDDVALLFVESENQNISLTTANGFVEVLNSPQGVGTAAAVGATRLAVYWARATSASMASPVVADSGDHTFAVILTYRGVIKTGNPWDATAGSTKTPASTTTTFDAVTTSVDNTLIVLAAAVDLDANSTTVWSGFTNANLSGLTKRFDQTVNTGDGGGLGLADGAKVTAGDTTTTAGTLTSSVTAQMTVALKPPPVTITVGTTGSQTSSMLTPSTNQYVGGAFTLIRNEGSANVTAITISETDASLVAQTYLANVKLFYKQEVACSASIPGDATAFNATGVGFNASEKAAITGDSAMAVGTSQICVYVQLNVASGAPNGDTFDIEITDPFTEVTASAGVVSPATAVAISGATTINLAPAVKQDHFRWRNDNGPQGDTSQTLYFNPTGNGFAMNFTIVGGCTAGSEWDCVDDGTADTQSTAPTSDLETSQLKSVNGKSYYTLVNDALPAGATVTQLDITASGVDDVGNPNTSLTLGYCTTCDGATDLMGSAQAVTGADQTKTQQFVSLSLSTTDMNNMQLVVQGSGVNAEISTLYVLVTYTIPAATWRQAEDIVETGLAKNTNIRLRFQIDNTGGSANSYNYRLEWAAQSGTCDTTYTGESYAAVPDVPTTQHFDMTLSGSSLFVDGDPTTAQLSNAEAFTFVAGDQVESTSNQSGAITLAQNQYTEVEYVFQANTNATDGGAYCFRVTNAGTALDSADVVAQVTLAGGGASPTLTFSLSDTSIGFGNLSATDDFFATGDLSGSAIEVEAHTITASTNATNGYTITVEGTTLTCSACGGATISAIGGSNTSSSTGSEQFGLRLMATGGNGSVSVPYAATGFALDTAAFPDQVASDPDGDDVSTTYSVRYLANIANTTEAGSYSAVLTYVVTGNF